MNLKQCWQKCRIRTGGFRMAKTYYTIQGDMWDGIAKKLYDDESGVNALLEANQKYADIVVFPAGIILDVPDYEKPTPTNLLPPWRR